MKPSTVRTLDSRMIEFEAEAAGEREHIQRRKKLYRFDESLKRLKEAGFERHPRPAEIYNLIMAAFERELTEYEERLYRDLLVPNDTGKENCFGSDGYGTIHRGEFLSIAMELVYPKGTDMRTDYNGKPVLVTYLDPEGLEFQRKAVEENRFGPGAPYYEKGVYFNCKETREFELKKRLRDLNCGCGYGKVIYPQDAGDDFAEYVFGRPYQEFPKELREENGKHQVHILLGYGVCPMGFGTSSEPGIMANKVLFDVAPYFRRASRGARQYGYPPVKDPSTHPPERHISW